ncbi:hypothetical protein DPMN_148565 [Dreissena polymorpha]|uniref:General transcription factor 3C polypeptide 5 n=1 Tax=Dreissena polymorpha TaxID=45954 RepID=A0A9D4J1N1_DREPO|nr:hypothetical protein DPMN_148565 [Dreissena polymorpha]
MSVWTESNKRIDVEYNGSRTFLCVEHPALISNPEKAVKTLGGVDAVAVIFNDPVKRLPLRWRPEDIYSKPTYGDRFNVSNLLMKVVKRRRKSDGKEDYRIEVFGIINVTYRFASMTDFQYLPMRSTATGEYESIYEKVVIDHLVSRKKYFSTDVPLYIPPMTFSRVDRPVDFSFRAPIKHRTPHYKNPDDTRPDHYIGTVRQRRTIFTVFVNFGESVPTQPVPEAVEKMKSEFVDQDAGVRIQQLFEEKPLWLKVELEHVTGVSSIKLKVFLPALCFYWLDGPWRGQWNRFGFDPTAQPSAKIYQTIDFRIRQVKPGQRNIKCKRNSSKLMLWNQITRSQKQNVKINVTSLQESNEPMGPEEVEENKRHMESMYKFDPDIIPPQRMMYYPVCYVNVPEIQQLLHSNDGKYQYLGEIKNAPTVRTEPVAPWLPGRQTPYPLRHGNLC